MNRIATSGFLVSAVLALLLPLQVLAQSHSGFPVDIIAGPAPQPFMADGREHLLYELHLTNYAPLPIELTGIDVFGDATTPLASIRGPALGKVVIPVEKLSLPDEPPSSAVNAWMIGEGHSVLIFLDLVLDPGARPPSELDHQFSFSVARKTAPTLETTLHGPVVSVLQEPAPVLRAPLRGSGWIAFNALGSADHRRSLNAVDGKERIPQRFAIDWMRLGPDGRLFQGYAKSNSHFYDYGAEVLAVADGRVSDLKDGLPENIGSNDRSSRHITLDNVVGNYVILDLGTRTLRSLCAPATRQPEGEARRSGEGGPGAGADWQLGQLRCPHLHFQVTDANSPLGAEGIPYELESFTQLGMVDNDPAVQDSGQILLPKSAEKPVVRRREFPVNNAVVTFP
jgi:hypothetical protein